MRGLYPPLQLLSLLFFSAPWFSASLLGGSWDLVSEVINNVTILITPIKVLITLLTKSHDPPK